MVWEGRLTTRHLRLALVAVALAAALVPPVAGASFPGRNGMLAITEHSCSDDITDGFIIGYSANGRRGDELTPECDVLGDPDDQDARDTSAPDWSPDGQRLIYADHGGEGVGPRIRTVAADGTGAVAVGPPGVVDAPSFAPDGRRFVYLNATQLVVASTDGGAPTVLRDNSSELLSQPQWSPTGNTIAVLREGSASRAGLWLISAQTGRFIRRVVKGEPASHDWSPDGRRLVYASNASQNEDGKVKGANLFIVRASGKGRARRFVRTTNVAATNPVWSPDGRSIAWVQLRFTAGDVGFDVIPTLRRRRVAGGRVRKLAALPRPPVEEGYYLAPDLAWQPLPRR